MSGWPSWRNVHQTAGMLLTAVFGGIWGWTLARVLSEAYPLGPAGPPRMPCVLWSPGPRIVLGLLGAAGAPLSSGWRASRAPKERRSGWAAPALSWPLALGLGYLVQPAVVPLWGVGALVAGLAGAVSLHKDVYRNRLGKVLAREKDTARPALRLREATWGLVAFVLPLALYVSTLAPSVLPGDSGEFQFVAPTLGIPHPTGYPLYLLLGKLFSLVPLGSVAYRLNLLSAVAAAGTVWAVYRCGRALGLRRPASLLGAALLAISETFWSQATLAEKYALNAFFVALTLWLGLLWRQRCSAARSSERGLPADGLLSVWAFCYGLSLAHHRTMLLLLPAYLCLVWVTDRRALARSAIRLALWTLAPLSLYLLLPLFSARQPPYAYIRLDSARAFFDLVLARDYQGALFRGGWTSLPGRLAELARLFPRQFGVVGLAAAIAGWIVLYRRNRPVAFVLALGIGAQVAFALNYYVPNTAVYYLPAYVWLALCISSAVDAVLAALARWGAGGLGGKRTRLADREGLSLVTRSAWPHLALAFALVVAAWPTALLAARWPGMDRRQTYGRLAYDRTYGQMAAWYTDPGALLIGDWMPATVLWYAQWIEGRMPTAQVTVADPLEGQWVGPVEGALANDRPAYLARPLIAAGDRHCLTSAGPLVRVLDAPRTDVPLMSHRASERRVFEGDVGLLGADLVATMPGAEGAIYVPSDGVIRGGSTLHVTVYWRALHPPAGDYGVTLRLLDVDPVGSSPGHSWLERTSRHPVGGTYPTSRWQAGEVVGDYYELPLPPHLSSGDYQLSVSMGLSFEASRQVSLARISVRKPPRWQNPVLGTPVRELFAGGPVLVGYDAPPKLIPGETASVAVQWLVCRSTVLRDTGAGSRPRLVLVSQEGTERPLRPVGASGDPDRLDDWQPGALVVDSYAFAVPSDVAHVAVRGDQSSQRVYKKPRGTTGGTRYRLRLQVASAPPPGTNFGDLVRLRSYDCKRTSLEPGATVHLTLEWETIQRIDQAYKVFVHVLGPNGLPIAQQDNEPVNGTYPTTRWQPGERVSDPYAIRLPDDLPPGEYPVEVGLYRISDLSRLPVLDGARSVVDDKVFLTPLTVR